MQQSRLTRSWLLASFGIVVLAAIILFFMGRVPYCECGYVKLWQGVVASAENSQHIADWYSFSHIIHGILFFAAGYLLFQRYSLGLRLLLATLVESAWEVFENTPFIINRYREITISWGYTGDSILNSVCDILFMTLGFWLALRLPWWLSVLSIVVLEVFVGYMIRDNLALNIIMLIYPFPGIQAWQSGG